jgi:hypothetical protein
VNMLRDNPRTPGPRRIDATHPEAHQLRRRGHPRGRRAGVRHRRARAGQTRSRRAEADVSAVADPATGVSVYDSYAYQGYSGWLTFGGTSASSPIIAAVYGLAGNAGSIDNNYPYSHSTILFDVTSGSNGSCSSQWCKARAGWDGPTGLGTPNGVAAF